MTAVGMNRFTKNRFYIHSKYFIDDLDSGVCAQMQLLVVYNERHIPAAGCSIMRYAADVCGQGIA